MRKKNAITDVAIPYAHHIAVYGILCVTALSIFDRMFPEEN